MKVAFNEIAIFARCYATFTVNTYFFYNNIIKNSSQPIVVFLKLGQLLREMNTEKKIRFKKKYANVINGNQ